MIYTYLNPKIALMGPGCVQEISRHEKEGDLELLAENAMKDVCRLTNPRQLSKEEIVEIYKRAM